MSADNQPSVEAPSTPPALPTAPLRPEPPPYPSGEDHQTMYPVEQ